MKVKKTKMEQLATFKKANKEYKIKLAEKAGFKTAGEYLASLTGKSTKKTVKPVKSKEKPLIHNVFILDASGSMAGGKLINALEGINSEIKELQKDKKVDYLQTIVDFSSFDDIKTPYFKVKLSDVVSYTTKARDMTALNQAIGETLERIVSNQLKDEKVLVKIFTDGLENHSRKYKSNSELSKFIKECESKGFTITFVGTNSDVAGVIRNLSIDVSNTLVHNNTPESVKASFKISTESTINYSSKVLRGENVLMGFYKEEGVL